MKQGFGQIYDYGPGVSEDEAKATLGVMLGKVAAKHRPGVGFDIAEVEYSTPPSPHSDSGLTQMKLTATVRYDV